MYSLLRFHLHHAHVTKINTEIKENVTLGQWQENGSRSVEQERVKFAILSKVCLLTAEIALQRLSFFLSFFTGVQSSQRRLPLIAEILKSLLLPI